MRHIHLMTTLILVVLNMSCGASRTDEELLSDIRRDLDGYKIVFASGGRRGSHIWMMDADGQNERDLTPELAGDSQYPEWGPKGKYIYFVSTAHGGTYEAYRVGTGSSAVPEQLTNFGKDVRNVAVSADGSMISIALMSANSFEGPESLAGYSADLIVANMETLESTLANDRLLTRSDCTSVREDPQSQHIWHEQQEFIPTPPEEGLAPLIAYGRTTNYDDDANTVESLWLVRADGTDAELVLEDESMPRWTSDGKALVGFGFTVTDLETRTTRRLRVDGVSADAGSVSLSPRRGYVLFEDSDRRRRAAIAREQYQDTTTPNPYTIIGSRRAFEPRFSPIPVP